jgi:hypothetical protein
VTMSLFTLQSRCTNPTKHPLHRPSVDQTVKSKQPPIHRLLPRIPIPSVQESVEMEHVSTTPVVTATNRVDRRIILSGYGRFHLVLSERQHFPVETSGFPESPRSNRHLERWNMCPPPRILPRIPTQPVIDSTNRVSVQRVGAKTHL